jgi:23S rRNA pseudouridine1911/1915/1917 synthase
MEILYEDNHVLALNKPSGLLTQASGTDQNNLEAQAKEWIKNTYHKPGNVFLHAVHRLDRAASGVVLMARTSKALSRLNESIRTKNTRKCYYAIVNGYPVPEEGTLEHYMRHAEHQAEIVESRHPEARLARLKYRVLQIHQELALIEIELETGRYHQIRAQMATIGCPILGDARYGGLSWKFGSRIALHHYQLEIAHPTTKQLLSVTAPLPAFWPIRP